MGVLRINKGQIPTFNILTTKDIPLCNFASSEPVSVKISQRILALCEPKKSHKCHPLITSPLVYKSYLTALTWEPYKLHEWKTRIKNNQETAASNAGNCVCECTNYAMLVTMSVSGWQSQRRLIDVSCCQRNAMCDAGASNEVQPAGVTAQPHRSAFHRKLGIMASSICTHTVYTHTHKDQVTVIHWYILSRYYSSLLSFTSTLS